MLEQLSIHIARHELCKTTDKILVAVSGGLDSMVMLHLLLAAGYKTGVAHCNFQLRGAESAADQEIVRRRCADGGIPFFAARFDTNAYAAARGLSIQMAARDLRYAWFQEVSEREGYDLVATGHHAGDLTESVLLNLIRGTGIDGFRGIAAKKDRIIRPLLFATRDQISAYAREHGIVWREDASNDSDDYARNFVRHQIVPRLHELNPSFEEGFQITRERLLGARDLMVAYLDLVRSSALHRSGGEIRLDIEKITTAPSPAVLLWELIKEHGFKYEQCRKIVAAHQAGKFFESTSHRLVVDRSHYIIDGKRSPVFRTLVLQKGDLTAGAPPFALSLEEVPAEGYRLERDARVAQLDADRVNYPLTWRRWQAGDYFVPLGMRQEKKLSDFLIDLKIPFHSKADVTVLESNGEIIWVVGFRISDRYKVTADTRRVLVVRQTR